MPDRRRANCRHCGRNREECGDISWSGACVECGKAILLDNIDGIHERNGIPWARWKMGYARRLFGPEATAALAQAGYFTVTLPEDS
jgi:hypothetical protein